MSPFAIWRRLLGPLAATATATAALPVVLLMVAKATNSPGPPPQVFALGALAIFMQSIAGTAAARQVAEHRAGRPPLVRRALARAAAQSPKLAVLALFICISFALVMFFVAISVLLVTSLLPFVPDNGGPDPVMVPALITGVLCWLPVGFTLTAAWPVLATEQTSAFGAVKRAILLLQGRWVRTIGSLVGPFLFGLLPFAALVALDLSHPPGPKWVIVAASGALFLVSCVTMQLFTCATTVRLLDAGLAGGSVRPAHTEVPRGSLAGIGATPMFQLMALATLISGGLTLYNAVATGAYASLLSYRAPTAPAWTGREQGVFEEVLSLGSFGNGVLAVGEQGMVLLSTDDGATWSRQVGGTTAKLWGVTLRANRRADAVGENGTMIYSTDGGHSWQPRVGPNGAVLTNASLADLAWATDTTGVAVGTRGTILQTTDGGSTWAVRKSGTDSLLLSVAFRDTYTGGIVGLNGTLLTTADSGQTWHSTMVSTRVDLRAIAWTAEVAMVVGDNGTLLRSTDGGTTWTQVTSPVTDNLLGVSLAADGTGVAVGAQGTTLRTTDRGLSWTKLTWPSNGNLSALAQTSPGHFVSAGQDSIFTSADAGLTWTTRDIGRANVLNRISMLDPSSAVAVGLSGSIIRTTDAGKSWTVHPSGTEAGLFSVAFNANTGLATGLAGAVLRSEDGGVSWHEAPIDPADRMYDVTFTDARTAIAVGDKGAIYRTVDAGRTWTRQTAGLVGALVGVSFADASNGMAVGSDGVIMRTTNGGATWARQNSGTTAVLWGVHMLTPTTAIAVGRESTLLRTTDGGSAWTRLVTPSPELNDVLFLDASIGFVVGYEGTIQMTTDGGVTWTARASGTTDSLAGISFSDRQHGVIVGGRGTILRSDDGGMTWTRP